MIQRNTLTNKTCWNIQAPSKYEEQNVYTNYQNLSHLAFYKVQRKQKSQDHFNMIAKFKKNNKKQNIPKNKNSQKYTVQKGQWHRS